MIRIARGFIPFLFAVTSIGHSFAQGANELDFQNGFKDIKLGTPISKIDGAKLEKKTSKKGELPRKLYRIQGNAYKTIGGISVAKVAVEVYKGIIYEINVITTRDQKLMKALEKRYGKPAYDMRENQYAWSSANVKLTFESYRKNKIQLTYTSIPMRQLMQQEKTRKIERVKEEL